MQKKLPRVLIVSGAPLDDTRGVSSSLVNFFQNYEKDKLAQIYFESSLPNTKLCDRFFQISEMSQMRKLLLWRTQVGTIIKQDFVRKEQRYDTDMGEKVGKYVREHRSFLFVILREFIWGLNLWKNKRLIQFIRDFDPDIVWFESYPLWFMHRLCKYVADVANKPSVVFLQDDFFRKRNETWYEKIYRYKLCSLAKSNIERCSGHFVASEKMKEEFDKSFNIDSIFLAKSINEDECGKLMTECHEPIKMLYTGNVVYGRIFTLLNIAKALQVINKDRVKFELNIYTFNYISEEQRTVFDNTPGINICKPVPYSEIPQIIDNSDILLVVESFEQQYRNVARLSFSTKIIDSLSSGKCIIALGPSDIAPMEYLSKNDVAIYVNSPELIQGMIENISIMDILSCAKRARGFVLHKHSKKYVDEVLFGELSRVAFDLHPRFPAY